MLLLLIPNNTVSDAIETSSTFDYPINEIQRLEKSSHTYHILCSLNSRDAIMKETDWPFQLLPYMTTGAETWDF